MNIFSLDISKNFKTTDSAISRDEINNTALFFRLYDDDKYVDYNEFNELTLEIARVDGSNDTIISSTTIANVNGEKLIYVELGNLNIIEQPRIFITPIVRINGISITLSIFRLQVYEELTAPMQTLIQNVELFNHLIYLNLNTIPRTEIAQANGVIPLNIRGEIEEQFLPDGFDDHPQRIIINTTLHGLRMNASRNLEYYHEIWDEWVQVNSVFGGRFGRNNDAANNIFGGNFTDTVYDENNKIFGGKF